MGVAVSVNMTEPVASSVEPGMYIGFSIPGSENVPLPLVVQVIEL